MFTEPIALALLTEEIIDLLQQGIAEYDVLKLNAWLAKFQQPLGIAPWCGKGDRNAGAARTLLTHLIDRSAQILSRLSVPLPGFRCGNLKRNRQKRILVALDAALKHSQYLLRARHCSLDPRLGPTL